MALADLSDLDRFHVRGSFPGGMADDDHAWGRAFFGPADDADGALIELVRSAEHSLFIAVRTPAPPLSTCIAWRLEDSLCYVQLTQDDELFWEAAVIDSLDVVTGNLSRGTDIVVIRDQAWAAYYQAQLSAVHSFRKEQDGRNA